MPFTPPTILMIGAWPLIMGVTMFLQQKLNPQPVDPVQARMFMLLPIVFTYMLAAFPAGLVIYWAWNNLLSIAQQWVDHAPRGCRLTGRWTCRASGAGQHLLGRSFRRATSTPTWSRPGGGCSPREARFIAGAAEPIGAAAGGTARDRLCRPLQCRQVEPRQRADRPPHAGADLEHAGPDPPDQFL